jgi:hypothetical protein
MPQTPKNNSNGEEYSADKKRLSLWTNENHPSPKTSPTCLLHPIVWEGFAGLCGGQRITMWWINNFLLSSKKSTNSFTWRKPNNTTTNLVLDTNMGYSLDNAAKHLGGFAFNKRGGGKEHN